MSGKERCKALKEIRRRLAEENNIEYVVSECTYQGECKGTCPKCEEELRYLEKELEKRKKVGTAIVVAGVALGLAGGAIAAREAVVNWVEEQMTTGILPNVSDTDL